MIKPADLHLLNCIVQPPKILQLILHTASSFGRVHAHVFTSGSSLHSDRDMSSAPASTYAIFSHLPDCGCKQ